MADSETVPLHLLVLAPTREGEEPIAGDLSPTLEPGGFF